MLLMERVLFVWSIRHPACVVNYSSRFRNLAHFRKIMQIIIKDLGHLNGFRA